MGKRKAEEADAGTSVSVRLSKDLLEYVDTRAKQDGRSRSNFIKRLVEKAKEEGK